MVFIFSCDIEQLINRLDQDAIIILGLGFAQQRCNVRPMFNDQL